MGGANSESELSIPGYIHVDYQVSDSVVPYHIPPDDNQPDQLVHSVDHPNVQGKQTVIKLFHSINVLLFYSIKCRS